MSGVSIPRPLVEQVEAVEWEAGRHELMLEELPARCFAARTTAAARAERLRAAATTLRGLAALTAPRAAL